MAQTIDFMVSSFFLLPSSFFLLPSAIFEKKTPVLPATGVLIIYLFLVNGRSVIISDRKRLTISF
ncbi:MAG: hypothetical protein RLZZ338_860 [Cyanobacteriota bacterium]